MAYSTLLRYTRPSKTKLERQQQHILPPVTPPPPNHPTLLSPNRPRSRLRVLRFHTHPSQYTPRGRLPGHVLFVFVLVVERTVFTNYRATDRREFVHGRDEYDDARLIYERFSTDRVKSRGTTRKRLDWRSRTTTIMLSGDNRLLRYGLDFVLLLLLLIIITIHGC